MHVDWLGSYDCHKAPARSRWARVYSRRSVVDHCRVDGHLRVASDYHGSGARCLQVGADLGVVVAFRPLRVVVVYLLIDVGLWLITVELLPISDFQVIAVV